MKKGWEVKKLGEVCNYERGLTYSKKDEVDFSSNVVFRATNINLITNSLDFNELKYINENVIVHKNKKVSKGSIIICTASGSKSHLGKVALIDDDYDYAFGGFMGQISPNLMISSKFLFYTLTSEAYKEYIGKLSDGVNINNLKFDDLMKYSFLLPPIADQQRIVAILDETFEAIAKAKANAAKNLQNARDLFESYLESVFANPGDRWEEKKLGQLCIIKPPKSEAKTKLSNPGLVSFVPMEDLNIKQKHFDSRQVRTLKEVEGSYTYFAEKDVLLAKITPCFENGKLGIAKNLKNSVGFGSSEYIVFRTNESLFNEYLYYFLSREQFRVEGAQRMSGAVGHKRVAKEFIENYMIPLPPIPEQHLIVAKLDTISAETKKLEVIYQKKLADLEELKKSILQKAFEGELTT